MVVLPLLAALGLACVHLFSQQLRFLDGVPRSRFLPLAGGMAVAFVLLRLLPAVDEGNAVLNEALRTAPLAFIEHHAHPIFLLGLLRFYGAEILVRGSVSSGGNDQRPRAARGAQGQVGPTRARAACGCGCVRPGDPLGDTLSRFGAGRPTGNARRRSHLQRAQGGAAAADASTLLAVPGGRHRLDRPASCGVAR